jgi:hypothetical protein
MSSLDTSSVSYLSMSFRRLRGFPIVSPTKRQIVAAKINRGMAILTSVWILPSPGHSKGRERSSLIFASSCSKKTAISCSIVSFGTLWRIRSWYVPSDICLKPRRIGNSGLLVTKTRNETSLRSLARERSWRIARTSSSRSHSSNASITTTNPRTFG